MKKNRFDLKDEENNQSSLDLWKENSKNNNHSIDSNDVILDFKDLNRISKRLIKNLKKQKFNNPLPVQSVCLPLFLKGTNFICVAETGSGKTLSFVLPICYRTSLFYKSTHKKIIWDDFTNHTQFRSFNNIEPIHSKKCLTTLVLSPSKDLAIQIYDVFSKMVRKTYLEVTLLLGEDNKTDQFKVNI